MYIVGDQEREQAKRTRAKIKIKKNKNVKDQSIEKKKKKKKREREREREKKEKKRGGGGVHIRKVEWLIIKALPQRYLCCGNRWKVHILSVKNRPLFLFFVVTQFQSVHFVKHSSVKNLWEKAEGERERERGKLVVEFYF